MAGATAIVDHLPETLKLNYFCCNANFQEAFWQSEKARCTECNRLIIDTSARLVQYHGHPVRQVPSRAS